MCAGALNANQATAATEAGYEAGQRKQHVAGRSGCWGRAAADVAAQAELGGGGEADDRGWRLSEAQQPSRHSAAGDPHTHWLESCYDAECAGLFFVGVVIWNCSNSLCIHYVLK